MKRAAPVCHAGSLTRVDVSTLSDITEWIDFTDMLRLYMTGDRHIVTLLSDPDAIRSIRCTKSDDTLRSLKALRRMRCHTRDERAPSSPPINRSWVTNVHLEHFESREENNVEFANLAVLLLPQMQNLSHLTLHVIDFRTLYKLACALPRGLVHLDIVSNDAGFPTRGNQHSSIIAELPRSLTSLRLDTTHDRSASDFTFLGSKNVQDLPPDHTMLHIAPQLLSGDDFLKLPRSITHLYLSSPICDEDVLKLPHNLRYLELDDNCVVSNSTVAVLPRSLTHLDGYYASTVTDAGLEMLPKELTNLNLDSAKGISGASFLTLPSQLTSLDVGSAEGMFSDDDMRHLPRTLLHLNLDVPSRHLSDAGIEHLPRKLRLLDITSARRITDAGFEKLPPSLEILYVVSAELLTARILHSLPKYLNMSASVLPGHLVQRHAMWRAIPHAPAPRRFSICTSVLPVGFFAMFVYLVLGFVLWRVLFRARQQ